ncbi:MAG TPA: GNAT family N-acetyltransferase [Thermoanaerobaculia bacterium]
MSDTITLRPRREDDWDFIVGLYATTRDQEMAIVPWTDEEKSRFLQQQCRAQTEHYDRYYEGADFLIVEKNGERIGRLYVDRQPDAVLVLDIAIMPEHRNGGLGTRLMRQVMEEAAAEGKSVTIHVENFNPARHLYDRLGFRYVDTNGVYHLMEWRAQEKETAWS